MWLVWYTSKYSCAECYWILLKVGFKRNIDNYLNADKSKISLLAY